LRIGVLNGFRDIIQGNVAPAPPTAAT